MKKVKTAVVGCGKISNIYIRNMSKLFSIIDLAAVCDIIPEAAREKAELYGVPEVLTLDEILEDETIELVVNLTGPVQHYEVLKKALEAGKHAYTEKMFTTDLDQSRELVKMADEKGLYLGVAPDTVLGAGIQTAKKVIESGMIGSVSSAQIHVNRNHSLFSEFFPFLRNPGGAFPYDVGIYYIASMIALLGSADCVISFGNPAPLHTPEILFANADVEPWQIPGQNAFSASIRMKNDVLVSVLFDGNTINTGDSGMTVYGTEGILKIGDPNTFDSSVTLIRPESGECKIPFTHGYDGTNTLMDDFPFAFYGNRGVGVAEMAWAICMGRKNNRCSKEYGLHCQEILYGMEQSASTGTVYKLESACEMEGLKSGYYSTCFDGLQRGDAEASLIH